VLPRTLLLLFPCLLATARADSDLVAAMERLDALSSASPDEALAAYLDATRHPHAVVRWRALLALRAHAGGSRAAADAIRQGLFDIDARVRRGAVEAAAWLPDGFEWIREAEERQPRECPPPSETPDPGDWILCGRAIDGISRSRRPGAAAELEAMWGHGSPFVLHKVALGLAHLGDAGAPALVRGLASEDPTRRHLCARELALGKGAVDGAADPLARLLSGGDPQEVGFALRIGLRLGPEAAALVPLVAALPGEHDPLAREFLVRAGPAGAAALLAACRRAPDAALLGALARADLEGLDLLPPLRALSQSPDRNLAAAAAACLAVAPTRDDDGVEALVGQVRANGRLVTATAWRLARKASPETLTRLLYDADQGVRHAAALAAASYPLALPDSRAPLERMLAGDADPLRVEAATALARHAEGAAIPALLAELARRIERKDKELKVDRAFARLGEGAVAPLVEALKGGDARLHAAAAHALAALGGPREAAVPALVSALSGGDPTLRIAAQRALVSIGEPAVPLLLDACASAEDLRFALPALARLAEPVERLSRGRGLSRLRAALAGALRDVDTIPVLERLLADPDPATRTAAAGALATRSHPALRTALADASPGVRLAALAGVVRKPRDGDVDLIAPLLGDPGGEVVSAAARALAGMGAPGRAALLDALRKEPFDTSAQKALLSVMHLCGAEAVPLLTQVLGHRDAGVALAAAGALGSMGDLAAPAAPSLVALLDRKPDHVARSALSELRDLGEVVMPALLAVEPWREIHEQAIALIDLDAAPELISALAEPGLRAKALRGLGLLGPSAELAVPELTALLSDGDERTVLSAIEALKAIGRAATPAAPALRALTADPRVGRAAASALAEIGR